MNKRTQPGTSDWPPFDAVAGLGSLDDPLRRRLYDYVCEHGAVSREEVATAADIGRTLAAYHLDKLVRVGLLSADYQRPPDRRGPGAGRPAKFYRRAEREVSVSVPPREYALLADLLVRSVEDDPTGSVLGTAARAAEKTGRDLARAGGSARDRSDEAIVQALRRGGYQPGRCAGGDVELRNCPFHRVAQAHQDTVCRLNLHVVTGLLEGVGADGGRARLDPAPGRCCVVVGTG